MTVSTRAHAFTGLAALTACAIAISPSVIPPPSRAAVPGIQLTAQLQPLSTPAAVLAPIAGLLVGPVDAVTNAVLGGINVYSEVKSQVDVGVAATAELIRPIPVIGPPIADQVNINYFSLISPLADNFVGFIAPNFQAVDNLVHDVAAGTPLLTALQTQIGPLVNNVIGLGFAVAFTVLNYITAQAQQVLNVIPLSSLAAQAPAVPSQSRVAAATAPRSRASADQPVTVSIAARDVTTRVAGTTDPVSSDPVDPIKSPPVSTSKRLIHVVKDSLNFTPKPLRRDSSSGVTGPVRTPLKSMAANVSRAVQSTLGRIGTARRGDAPPNAGTTDTGR